MRFKSGVPLIVAFLTGMATWLYYGGFGSLDNCKPAYFFEDGYIPDAFEYHLPAVNFALHNKFPYYGFISPMQDYRLSPKPDSVSYFCDTRDAGVIVFPSKPPLYSLLLGWFYRLGGIQPRTAMLLNLWCIALTCALMPLAGFILARYIGLMAGVLAAFIFLLCRNPRLWNADAEILTALLVMLTFTIGTLTWVHPKRGWYFLFGLSMGLLLLTKGYFVITALFVVIYCLYLLYKERTLLPLKTCILFILGNAIIILPWVAYINPLLQSNIPERLAFHSKLKAPAHQFLLNSHEELFDSTGKIRSDIIDDLNKFHQYQQAIENGFVVISNQYGEYNILNVNNEYCIDGDFHPEWRIVKKSFYNQYANQTREQKLWLFYSKNIGLGFKITLAKLSSVLNEFGIVFFVALLVMILLAWFKKKTSIMLVGIFLLLNILLVLVVFYGDIRFVLSVYPVALVLLVTGLYQLLIKYFFHETFEW